MPSPRRLLALSVIAALVGASSAFGASVTPTLVAGNPTCAALNPAWTGFKPVDRNPPNGTYTDGTLSVTIANDGPNGFDWSSNIGVDAVIVKAGPQANAYVYDPESLGDTGMATADKRDISHVDFCYDAGSPADPPLNDPPLNDPPLNDPPLNDPPATNTTTGTAPDQQQVAGTATDPGSQAVLGERVAPGSARLLAATGCASRAFNARVRGSNIARVVFKLDGKRIKTLVKPNLKGLYSVRINPVRYRLGVHRLSVTVKFKASTRTRTKTLRASFQRCSNRLIAPRFTG